MTTQLTCTIPLPRNFRRGDVLTFHRRDPHELAETVRDTSLLLKGMIWDDHPACLSIRFGDTQAEAVLSVDHAIVKTGQSTFECMIRRMLGLTQNVDAFEAHFRDHPLIGRLISQQPGLRVPAAATPFEALAWAITGQQISVHAAVSLRRKLILAADVRHSSGMYCHPDAGRLALFTEDMLRQVGFSANKARALLKLAELVVSGALPLDAWAESLPVEQAREQLESVRGIGPWTVNYALLRGFGWLDGSLHGDAALRRGLQRLIESADPVSEQEARTWLAQFSPWRALVCAYIWSSTSSSSMAY